MPAVTPVKRRSGVRRAPAEPGASAETGACAGALTLPGKPEHVRAAREFAALVLRAHAIDDDGTAGLLLSELISNSLAYSDSGKPGGTVTVTVTVTPGEVVAEVADDGGDGEPVLRDPPADAERGRGLRLVDELASAWGYSGGGKGQLVTWFALKALPRPAVAGPAPACPAGPGEEAGDAEARRLRARAAAGVPAGDARCAARPGRGAAPLRRLAPGRPVREARPAAR
jgi:serine/threonine-protein kinase RsbW